MIFEKHHPLFSQIKWLTKALSKDTTSRLSLAFLNSHAADGVFTLVATDGHRLHRIKTEAEVLPAGLWQVTANNAKMVALELSTDADLIYPEYEKVIPSKTGLISFDLNFDTTRHGLKNLFLDFVMGTGIKLDFDFFCEWITPGVASVYISPESKARAVYYQMETKVSDVDAIIMPLHRTMSTPAASAIQYAMTGAKL